MPHSERGQRSLFRVALLSLGVLAAGLASAPAHAATTRTGEEVIVAAHEVIDDDLVVWGPYIRIDGIVRGDVVALGTDIVVEGVVEGDLIAAGKTIHLAGTVGDDARLAAYAMAFGEAARLGDDAFTLGYSLETKPGSRIDGTLYGALRQALLAGQIAESLLLRAGALEIGGLVAGDVAVVVGGLEGVTHSSFVMDLALELPAVRDGIRLTPAAKVGGNLDYRAEAAATIEPGALVVGETHREPWAAGALPQADAPPLPEEATPFADAIASFAVLFLLGLALVAIAPRWAAERGEDVRDGPLGAVGSGLLAVVLTLAISIALGIAWLSSVALLATGAGAVALGLSFAAFFLQAGVLAPFFVATLYVAPALTSLAIGGAILARIAPTSRAGLEAEHAPATFRDTALHLLVGGLLYTGLCAIPGFGALVSLLGGLAGLGALFVWLRETRTA